MENNPITTHGFCPILNKQYDIKIVYEKEADSTTYTAKSFECDNSANCRLKECPIEQENKHFWMSQA